MHTTQNRLAEHDLAAVIGQHRGALFRYVARLTGGDPHLAEDIVQETVVRAWQHPAVMTTSHPSIRPWLFTVARNLVIDHHRRRSRAPEVLTEFEEHQVRDHADATLLSQDMTTALSRLSRDHRNALWTVYYRGHDLPEAARVLGIPVGTVKSRVHYGLRALGNIVRELGIPVAEYAIT